MADLQKILGGSGTSMNTWRVIFLVADSVAIIASALFVATASIGVNVYNSCRDFGPAKDRVSGLKIFFIIMIIIALLVFLGAIGLMVVFFVYGGATPTP